VNTGKKDSYNKDIYEWRKVVMPGIGLYRIDAARTGQYAGMTEPEFGEDVTGKFGTTTITYPKWCKVTVKKIIAGQVAEFTAKEFWLENYATAGKDSSAPNAMWTKRAYGQLAKCTEAQALRKAFPEAVGSDPTFEEMEGKAHAEVLTQAKPEPYKASIANIEIEQRQISLDDDLAKIWAATTLEDLQSVYRDAYKFYANKGDQSALQELMKAKDERKDEIQKQDHLNKDIPQ
jgi:phage recombination protein Bet